MFGKFSNCAWWSVLFLVVNVCVCVYKRHVWVCTFSTVKAYIRKGHALLGMKATVKASQAFEKALELDPNSVVSHSCAQIHAHTHARTPTPTTHAHARTYMRAPPCTYIHACTPMHVHTRMDPHARTYMGAPPCTYICWGSVAVLADTSSAACGMGWNVL